MTIRYLPIILLLMAVSYNFNYWLGDPSTVKAASEKRIERELDTQKVFDAIANEVDKLDDGKSRRDKSMHFAGSYFLCHDSHPFAEIDGVESSICILKGVIDSFKVGLKKEFQDVGKDFGPNEELFDNIIKSLGSIHNNYVNAGLTDERHETDLLANMIGLGTFMVNQSMRNLNWKLYDYDENIEGKKK